MYREVAAHKEDLPLIYRSALNLVSDAGHNVPHGGWIVDTVHFPCRKHFHIGL